MDLIIPTWQPSLQKMDNRILIRPRASGKTHWLAGNILPGETVVVLPSRTDRAMTDESDQRWARCGSAPR